MKPEKYKIWWSPVGHDNGSAVFCALSKSEALAEAKRRMQEMNGCGAYGADRI